MIDLKLLTKVKIAYVVMSVVPLILIAAAVLGISFVGLNAIEEQYDVSEAAGMEAIYNPFSLLGNVTSTMIGEIEKTIADDPDKMQDMVYLDKINAKLGTKSSYLVVKKDDQIVYSGVRDTGMMIDGAYLDIHADEGNLFVLDDVPYHLRMKSFTYSDGSAGGLFVVTNIDKLVPRLKATLIQMLLSIVCIFVLVGAVLMFWLYKSIIKPVDKLKAAAENIKEGNLNFSIDAQADDEIGELCVAFEEMRLKLKEQIDISMQYEKDNKELISNISHDLKTPITAIKGYIEGIMDGVADTPEKQERYFRTIYTKANDMQKLIEELFLYSKLDSNSMTYSFQKVNLNDYFEDCIEEISVDLESKHIGLGFFNYVDKNCVIIADPEQLKRVILNIVNNSAKYIDNPRGLVNIRLHEEPEYIQVEIEDNGKGIAPEELSHIFERCYRTDSSRNSAKGGSGLGLSIAKKIVEEHGGRIWATSKVGIGTSICFVIRKYEENRIYE
ncbi:MAG: HAMP domain-containing histidine kinase [Clostridiales bacterium]|nr:HAMP domain-containing histidine kinase [Clostridiales bacterium]MDY3746219.1 HAMP domain-containing sensor histidine kinase [Lachnospiraceae bacterium]